MGHGVHIGQPALSTTSQGSSGSLGATELPGCGGKRASAIAFATGCQEGSIMSVDTATVRKIARLARIAVAEDEVEHLKGELNAMLAFVEQLLEVDVTGIEPMTSVAPMVMKKRPDVV